MALDEIPSGDWWIDFPESLDDVQDEYDRRDDRERVQRSWDRWHYCFAFWYLGPDDLAARQARVRWQRKRRERRKGKR